MASPPLADGNLAAEANAAQLRDCRVAAPHNDKPGMREGLLCGFSEEGYDCDVFDNNSRPPRQSGFHL